MPSHLPSSVRRTIGARRSGAVPATVLLLGAVSFFADVASEMVYPLVPIFLTTGLGAPVAVVGLIEGVAESTASLLRVVSGWWSDRVRRRLPLIVGGYSLGAVGQVLLAIATAWPIVLAARFAHRLGKGLRASPRDALIADSTAEAWRGRAFGLHRTMDTAGAVVGPLLALLLLTWFDDRLRLVFALAVIPALLSLLPLLRVRDPSRAGEADGSARPKPALSLRGFDRRLQLFLLANGVFALGNSSDAFLILRATDVGLSATAAVFAYVVYNLVYASASFPAGAASDRFGRRRVYVVGLFVFAGVYAGFALADRTAFVWPLFAVYGLYMALTDGIARALVADLAPAERRATALGVHGMLIGIAALAASIVAGQLWDHVGPAAPFFLGAGAAVASATLLILGPFSATTLGPRWRRT